MAANPKQNPKEVLERVLAKTTDLASLPQVIFRITEMAGSIETSAAELEKVITVDPGFTTKLLARVNSASYALPKEVTSIRDAVAFIGLKGVRQLAMTVGVFDMFLGKTDEASLRRRAWWRHSVDTAVVAKMIANTYGGDGEEAYTCGLLHAIGRTALEKFDPESYAKIAAIEEKGVLAWQGEQVVFGVDHMMINQALGEKWGLPSTIVYALDYVSHADETEPGAKTRAAVALGEKIAALALSGAKSDDIEAHHLHTWAMKILNIPNEHAENLFVKGQEEVAKAAKMA